ncbi:MAG: hypothetical protein ACFFDH_03360 [Promethearchaeota archaeon]
MGIKTKGTKEWVDKTYGIYKGCENNCGYCYAKSIALYGGWCPSEGWDKPIFNERAFNQSVSKYYERGVMCFTSHDITPNNLEKCIEFILRIIKESENQILIVSKPNFICIKKLCEVLKPYRDRIEFRFTITSKGDSIAVEWEKEAPLIDERLLCLEYVFNRNWKVSVSIEPFLDRNPVWLIEIIYRFCDSIWLGIMSNRKYKWHTKENLIYVMEEIKWLPDKIRKKLHLKDSLSNLLNKYEINNGLEEMKNLPFGINF